MANNLNKIEEIPSPHVAEIPREGSETNVERVGEILPEIKKNNDKGVRPPTAKKPVPSPLKVEDQNNYEGKKIKAIENIMSSGLDKIFLEMSPRERKRFKDEGEKTALKISELLSKVRLSADKIVKLIKDWLKLIPGVNRFFLEQEAKIKTDKIINIKKSL